MTGSSGARGATRPTTLPTDPTPEELAQRVDQLLQPRRGGAAATPRRPENPVSAGLQVVRREPGRLEELKTIIDRIHDDGRLPRIPVDGNPPKGANGAYGFYPGDGRPARIAVRTYDGDAVTFAHEIGHFIDHQAMGTRGEYASKGSKEMASWRKAVRATALAQKLAEQKKNALFGKKRINYLLSPHELWARSYAQWIVLKARQGEFGSADLRAKMEAELKARLAGPFQGGHWSDEDFKPVAEAIDELMRKKGWLL